LKKIPENENRLKREEKRRDISPMKKLPRTRAPQKESFTRNLPKELMKELKRRQKGFVL